MTAGSSGDGTPTMSFAGEDVLRGYITALSNWGRWGEDDVLGTLNLVGPDEVIRAVATVEYGRTISCTLPLDQSGPQRGFLRNNPRNVMVATGTDHVSGAQDELPAGLGPAHGFGRSDDLLIVPNQAGTAWDALSHVFWEGKMWNGQPASLVSSQGAAVNGIEGYAGKMITRGVLLDVAATKQVAALEPGYPVSVEDLEAAAEFGGVEVMRGDALLVRTGHLEARRGEWGDFAGGPTPGLSIHTAPWLHAKEVAAVASDTWALEVRPSELGVFQPLHIVALVHMGLALGEMFDLEELAGACAESSRYQFLLVAPTLPITGASGSPTAVIAVL
jgi:kynurenine formamidase